MEEGFPLFDPNDEADRQEQRLREYYEEFSANARKRLLAKTIVRPITVYDVLYPATRNSLLSKNTPFDLDLEENARIIRDKLIAKIITSETDLEEISSNFRKSLLARAKIQDDRVNLMNSGESFRNSMISKNASNNRDISKDSESIRNSNISKNKQNPLSADSLEESGSAYRDNDLAKNAPRDQDLLRDSEVFRKNDIHKNVSNQHDNERDSANFRKNNLAKNSDSNTKNIEDSSVLKRQSELAKNTPSKTDIKDSSESVRDKGLIKNVPKDQDLLRDSETLRNQFRKNGIHKNVPIDSDIERDNIEFRRNNLAKNIVNKIDFEENLEIYRNLNTSRNNGEPKPAIDEISEVNRVNNLSKNTPSSKDIQEDSVFFRKDNLSKNSPIKSDIEKESADYRKDDLSLNRPKLSNLELDSAPFRKSDLSANKPSISNLEVDSTDYRADDLSKNVSKPTDLEFDSIDYRNDDLSLNKKIKTDLEKDSAIFRADDLSFNVPGVSNLEVDSAPFREGDLSFNVPGSSNLEIDSVPFRESDLSFNKPKITNLESDSVDYRSDDLSFNKPSLTNLEIDSVPFRKSDLSFNKPKITNLETDSVPFRTDDLSFNVPSTSNLETDSVPFRTDDLSLNVPGTSNLEIDSVLFRTDDLSANVQNTSDLETDSVPFRDDDLSANSSNNVDLFSYSYDFRDNNLAPNVPSDSDIASDSVDFRDNNIAPNVPTNSDLLEDSKSFRDDALAKNNGFGLLGVNIQGAGTSAFLGISRVFTQGILLRQLLLSKNTPKTLDIEDISGVPREYNLARNTPFKLDMPELEDRSDLSNLGKTGLFFRTENLTHRSINKYSGYISPANRYISNGSDTYGLGVFEYPSYTDIDSELVKANRDGDGELGWKANYSREGSLFPGSPVSRMLQNIADGYSAVLQAGYGTYVPKKGDSNQVRTTTIEFNNAVYTTNRMDPQGGTFDSSNKTFQARIEYLPGSVTGNIRLYNLQRNSFNIFSDKVYTSDSDGRVVETNSSLNGFEGFKFLSRTDMGFSDLIAKTIGSLGVKLTTSTQIGSNTVPESIVNKNDGAYYKGGNSDGDLLRPGAKGAKLGSAESMMAKTIAGNPFQDKDFLEGKRGVKHIINTIKKSSSVLKDNFDPQKNEVYIIGRNSDNTADKKSRQRFTIVNPYQPRKAEQLLFSLKNYSSGDQFYFPPYIQSISNTENVSWNSTNFLGRPEAVYTYNNSSRDASISFFVLTDYAQTVDIGTNWESDAMEKISIDTSKHFTDFDLQKNSEKKAETDKLEKERSEKVKSLAEIDKKINEISQQAVIAKSKQPEINVSSTGTTGATQVQDMSSQVSEIKQQEKQQEQIVTTEKSEISELEAQRKVLLEEIGKIDESLGVFSTILGQESQYSVTNNVTDNIYDFNMGIKEEISGEISSKPSNTAARISIMKEGLMFQPAFFSGDKVDFVRKVEFLSKLTRPSANNRGPATGFSFIKPPVCHIRLGTWWDHDIIVNSVGFDYSDAPWTLDGGQNVQPMWALVTISFNIIGPYGSANSRPPLSTDEGGMYSPY